MVLAWLTRHEIGVCMGCASVVPEPEHFSGYIAVTGGTPFSTARTFLLECPSHRKNALFCQIILACFSILAIVSNATRAFPRLLILLLSLY